MLGLAMQLGLATPLAFMAPVSPPPPPPPPGAVSVAPPSVQRGTQGPVAAPMVGQTVVVAPAATGGSISPAPPKTPPPAPLSTTTTTVYSGLECVVTLYAPDGTHMTYSPGPALNGACAVGTPEPVTSTS